MKSLSAAEIRQELEQIDANLREDLNILEEHDYDPKIMEQVLKGRRKFFRKRVNKKIRSRIAVLSSASSKWYHYA